MFQFSSRCPEIEFFLVINSLSPLLAYSIRQDTQGRAEYEWRLGNRLLLSPLVCVWNMSEWKLKSRSFSSQVIFCCSYPSKGEVHLHIN